MSAEGKFVQKLFSRAVLIACALPLVACIYGASNPPLPVADAGDVVRADGGSALPAQDGGAVTSPTDGGTAVTYQDCPAPGDGGAQKSSVVVMNPQNGTITKRIDLTCFAENAGYPRPFSIALALGKVYVALQDFDAFFSNFKNGKLVVIDPRVDRVRAKIDLAKKNISDVKVALSGLVYVAAQGTLGLDFPGFTVLPELTGGIDVIDPATDTVLRSIDDDTFGGNVTKLELVSPTRAYAVVAIWDTTTTPNENKYVIKRFNPTTGAVEANPIYRATGAFVSGTSYDSQGGTLYVAEGDYVNPRIVGIRESDGVVDPARTTALSLTPQSMDLHSYSGERKLVIVEPDFGGGVGVVEVVNVTGAPPFTASTATDPVSSDPVVRVQPVPGTLPNVPSAFVVNRFGADNIQWLDATAGFATRTIGGVKAQWSTGNGSNPQDVLSLSATKIYVTLQN